MQRLWPGPAILILLLASCARRSASQPPEEVLQRYLLARSLYSEQRLAEALQVLLDEHGRAPAFAASSFLAGKIRFFQQDYDQARLFWEQTLAHNPGHLDTSKWLARLLLLQGEVEEAERLVAAALYSSAEDPELLILMGRIRRSRHDLAGAIEFYRKAQLFSERLAEASLELAELYYGFGLRDRAEQELSRAQALLSEGSSLSGASAAPLQGRRAGRSEREGAR
jgi:tetratricopeptide (TPR) repeat protein